MARLPRVAFVHAGTHKTGSTSIQVMLGANAGAFADAGILVPMAGRVLPDVGGHHNLAWECTGSTQFDPAHGTIDDLLDEVTASSAPIVCLSSEEFEFLFDRCRDGLERLVRGLRAIGCDVRVLLYLRPQADYLESLYAEIVKAWDVSFDDFLAAVVRDGIFGASRFDYAAMTAAFADVVGADHVRVRAYRAVADDTVLLRDFIAQIEPEVAIDVDALAKPGRLNGMLGYADVLAAWRLHHGQGPGMLPFYHPQHRDDPQRFDPLGLADIARITQRFARSNAEVRRRYGASIGCATWTVVRRELRASVVRDARSRQRKEQIRSSEPKLA